MESMARVSRREHGGIAATEISVVFSAQQSVYLLMRDALTARGHGAVAAAVRSVRASAALTDHAFALKPIWRGGTHGLIPSALVPIPPRCDVGVPTQVARLHDYASQDFVDDVGELGATTTAVWQDAADNPKRWLASYADASMATWRRIEPWWRAARPLMDREVERIGVASVRGGLDAALNTLSPRLRFANDAFYLDGLCNRPITLGDRRLVLVPLIAAHDALFIHLSEPDLLGIAYPVRGLGTLDAPEPVATDQLSVVLGVARARVLRGLDVATTMGQIAAHIGLAPGSATRHCDQLERAGLIIRQRRGKAVQISRTDRGSELLDLLS